MNYPKNHGKHYTKEEKTGIKNYFYACKNRYGLGEEKSLFQTAWRFDRTIKAIKIFLGLAKW